MPQPREHPYIWATWLARLLAGETHCQWAGWFRAHYQDWTRPPSDFDNAKWMLGPHHTRQPGEGKQRIPGIHRLCGKPELLPSQGPTRHLGRQARPHRGQEQRRRDHRRQDWQTQPSPRRPSNDLPVCPAQGPGKVPGHTVQRPHRLSRVGRGYPQLRDTRELRGQLGSVDMTAGSRLASPKGAQSR